MKLAFYEKFYDCLINLPSPVQRSVKSFINKFRNDSTSASIHLEPISTFRDPQLRTARVNKKYRAIIYAPKTGTVYSLLWVDNHDEAMAWAKDKMIEWNENTQSYQIFTAPEVITPSDPKNPDTSQPSPSSPFAQFRDRELMQAGIPEILLPSVREIQDAHGLEKMEQFLPKEAFESLFYLLDGVPLEHVLRDLEEGKVQSDDFADQSVSANNQRSFFEVTDDAQLNDMLSGTLQKWKIYLHPSQRRLVEGNFKGSTKVTGGAGTGKTVAAMHRAKYVQDNALGRGYKPIFFTTFTKSLIRNLEQEFKGMGIDPQTVHLKNIDAFLVEDSRRLGIIDENTKVLNYPGSKSSLEMWYEVLDLNLSEFDAPFLNAEYQEVVLYNDLQSVDDYIRTSRAGRKKRISRMKKMHIWNLIQNYQSLKREENAIDKYELMNQLTRHYASLPDSEKPYGHVIADEVQDFSTLELKLLRSLVPKGPNDLFLVGDPLQRIYKRYLNFTNAGINIRGKRSKRLKINYRTTEEIRRTAVNTIKNVDFDDFDGQQEEKSGYVSLVHGSKPDYTSFVSQDQEVSHVTDRIKHYVTDGLQPVHYADICIGVRTNKDSKPFIRALHKADIPYYDMTGKHPTGNKTSGVRVSTFHNMKGLEFKVVFLTGTDALSLPYKFQSYSHLDAEEKEAYHKQERALLYVAMTRAIQVLHLTGLGEASELVQV